MKDILFGIYIYIYILLKVTSIRIGIKAADWSRTDRGLNLRKELDLSCKVRKALSTDLESSDGQKGISSGIVTDISVGNGRAMFKRAMNLDKFVSAEGNKSESANC